MLHVQLDALIYKRALVRSVTVRITLADRTFGIAVWGLCMGITDIYYG